MCIGMIPVAEPVLGRPRRRRASLPSTGQFVPTSVNTGPALVCSTASSEEVLELMRIRLITAVALGIDLGASPLVLRHHGFETWTMADAYGTKNRCGR